MIRNLEIEKRIEERKNKDRQLKMNSYGGMGMDSISGDYKKMILEELDYMKSHPEIYYPKTFLNNPKMYLLNK